MIGPIAGVLALLSLMPLASVFTGRLGGPRPLAAVYRATLPFELVNRYGLFARMTVERPEITIEGSRDGRTWKAYEFRFKPGDPARAPRWFMPHMPRLDWQMWFAALDAYERRRLSPWLVPLCARLLENADAVTDLLACPPFAGGEPPRQVRLVLWLYRFTAPGDPSGAWWRRERLGVILGPVGLEALRPPQSDP